MVTTPMTYFAAHHLGTQSSVMVTGSHNPARLQRPQDGGRRHDAVGRRHPGSPRAHRCGAARHRARELRARADIAPAYVDRIAEDVRLARPLKIAVDCGNGVAGAFAPTLVPPAGLRSHRDVLRRRRTFSEPPPGPVEAREPARPDRIARARASTIWASRSTATATASAWSPATATSSTPTAS